MHARTGDLPHRSAVDTMLYWHETAAAIAARQSGMHLLEIASLLGPDDLFKLLLRPTPWFAGEKRTTLEAKVRTKAWMAA